METQNGQDTGPVNRTRISDFSSAETSKQTRLITLLVLILGIVFASSWTLNTYFQDVDAQDDWVLHTQNVIAELDHILSAIKDVEGGGRAFLLTDDQMYLAEHQQGILTTQQHLHRLKVMIEDNPDQTQEHTVLVPLVERRLAILSGAIDRHARKLPAFNSAVTGETKSVMQALREQVDKMKTNERKLLEKRQAEAERGKTIFVALLITSTILIASVILISFSQIARNQARVEKDNLEKAIEAREKNYLSDLSRNLSGDLTLLSAGEATVTFMTQQLDFLAAKLWFYDQGGLKLIAVQGAEGDDFTARGLVTAAYNRETVYTVTDIPHDYWKIGSGLGESKPTHLTFVPFTFQGKRLGVLELASFTPINDELNHLLTMFIDTIGVGLNAAQTRTELQRLLETTQTQAEELQTQQEELKSNNEELEQQARAMESQQQALNIKNKELEAARLDLEAKAADLQRSSQYKSEFLAKMSHELRTPLNGLLILSTLLMENKEKNLTAQQIQFSRSINGAGNDLLVLINDILDLSKIEARKLSLRPEDFTLKNLFNSKRLSFEPQAMAKKLELNLKLDPKDEQFSLFTDRQRLDQILRNFLSNAIKFTEQGSITLEARVLDNGNAVELAVSDTGIGIPENKRQLIFEAFEQADSSVGRKYGGTGLGLTISRELAQLLGGTISLQSDEGKGSRFILTIPTRLSETIQAERSEAAIPVPMQSRPSGSTPMPAPVRSNERIQALADQALSAAKDAKKTILLVEDDENFRASVVEAVKGYGFVAIEAGDGEVALAILQTHVPDAILLDIKLPGISGLGILEMIKQMPHLRHVPVHMISALEYQHNALRMGALGYLTKPVTIEKVHAALNRIENLLSKKLRRVLLIEDDEVQNEAVSQLISGNDIEVISARTGAEAVEKLKREGFDCIILDLSLPDVSGADLLSELRALDISLPPVVIYTGKDLTDEEEQYLRKYSESIIIKGARSPERLLDEVNLFLHRVETLLPQSKRDMLSNLRSQERVFESKTVLIVDDDIRNIFAMNGALEARGLKVRIARDGVEALEAVDHHPDIDLVLMDIMMPRMDGFEAMTRIRQSPNAKIRQLPVIALTAKAMREDHEKCMQAGASDYLPKPVNLENLTTILKVWLAPKDFLN